jgi:hypothetical protein
LTAFTARCPHDQRIKTDCVSVLKRKKGKGIVKSIGRGKKCAKNLRICAEKMPSVAFFQLGVFCKTKTPPIKLYSAIPGGKERT